MLYVLSCSCGEEHHISTSQAGEEIKCSCGKSIRIPTLRGIRELPPVVTNSEALPPSSSKSGWGGWRGTALAFATGIALVTAVAACYFLIQRLRIDTSFTEEVAIEAGDELLEQYGPYELSYVWNTYESEGLGPKTRPNYYWWNSYAEEMVFRATVMGCVAAIAGCVALGIWLTVKPS